MLPDEYFLVGFGQPWMQTDSNKSIITICGGCMGTGEVVEPFHHVPSGIEPKKDPCNRCGGSGRLKKTVSIHYERL